MARIYKKTDRIMVKIDDVVLGLAPLSLDQKTEIQQAMVLGRGKGDIKEATRGISLAIKYSVKSMTGVIDSDGPYKLQFDNDNNLTPSCIDDLMNLELTAKLAMVCGGLVNGIPKQFTDHADKPLPGVEIIKAQEIEQKNA